MGGQRCRSLLWQALLSAWEGHLAEPALLRFSADGSRLNMASDVTYGALLCAVRSPASCLWRLGEPRRSSIHPRLKPDVK